MDSIGDLINRIKTAGNAGLTSTTMPHSNVVEAIAEVLVKHGFIKSVSKKGKKVIKTLEVELLYKDNKPRVTNAARISKPSRRIYEKSKDIKPVRRGLGMVVLSTPSGIMTDAEARKANVGGEVLFKIW